MTTDKQLGRSLAQPALILCGGQSRRMGRDKALLPWQNSSLIAKHSASLYQERPVWIASGARRYQQAQGEYSADGFGEAEGALAAILPALQRAEQAGYAGIFVFSCDSLLPLPDVVVCLQASWGKDTPEAVILCDDARLYPLLSYWSVHLQQGLADYLQAGYRRIMPWLERFDYQKVIMPETWRTLANINTPEDYAAALRVWETLYQ